MKEVRAEIVSNKNIAREVFEMKLRLPKAVEFQPGQFVNVAVPGYYLRRPISVCDSSGDELVLIYKTFGDGTAHLSTFGPGQAVDVLLPLGNGFVVEEAERPALIGGGVGTPPLYKQAKALVAAGQKPVVVLGFESAADAFYEDEFRALGLDVHVATVDGTRGHKGFVTPVVAELAPDYIYACGPNPMLQAIHEMGFKGQYSFEERMGCGFGACMGCVRKTTSGYVRLCKEGPVLREEEITW